MNHISMKTWKLDLSSSLLQVPENPMTFKNTIIEGGREEEGVIQSFWTEIFNLCVG